MYSKAFQLIPSKTLSALFSSVRLGQQRGRRSGVLTEIVTTCLTVCLIGLRFGEKYTEGKQSL